MLFRLAQWAFSSITRLLRAAFSGKQSEQIEARVYWNDGVALTLQNLVHESETQASGRVQILTLAAFRASIPDLWDKYKDRILIITESTISRLIGKGNTFIPQGDDAWLLLFPAVSEEEAQARTDAMAVKIGEKLMGARFTPEAPPMPATAKIDLNGVLRADGTVDQAVINAAVDKARHAQAGASVTQAQSRATPKVVRPKPPAAIAPPVPELTLSFRLAWSAETQSLDTFSLRALNDMGVNVFADGAPSMSPLAAVAVVRNGAVFFRTMCAAGVRAKFSIPIQFSVLATPALAEIQQTIAEINQQARLVQLRITSRAYRRECRLITSSQSASYFVPSCAKSHLRLIPSFSKIKRSRLNMSYSAPTFRPTTFETRANSIRPCCSCDSAAVEKRFT